MPTDVRSPAHPRALSTREALGSSEIRRLLEDFVKRRVAREDVDDVVQTVLCDALASSAIPEAHEEMRKWLIGVARHKVADRHRRVAREAPIDPPEPVAAPAPFEARGLVDWAEKQAAPSAEAQRTLSWMAREGEGEKLESIAADEDLPAARVRQRVSRLRRWMKDRWLAELAAVAMLAALALIAYRLLRYPEEEREAVVPEPTVPAIVPEPPREPTPLDRARALRAEALRACDDGAFQRCLDGLDEAAGLDRVGDGAPEVVRARDRAREALTPTPEPSSSAQVAPPPKPTAVPPAKFLTPKSGPPSKPSPFDKTKPSAPKSDLGSFDEPSSLDRKK